MQFDQVLRGLGIEVEYAPLFDDDYLRRLYSKRGTVVQAVWAGLRRIVSVIKARRFSVLVVEKELLPWVPWVLERWMIPAHVKLVIDIDDAIFYKYENSQSRLARELLGGKFVNVFKRADLVTAGNEFLADYARRAGCRNVEIVPTVVDSARYPIRGVRGGEEARSPLRVVWVGSPSTVEYLRDISSAAANVAGLRRVEFVAIGAPAEALEGTPFIAKEWSEESEATDLASCDIGVMPLRDSLWERGKCGYKIVQYMAAGLPFVASPVGVNVQLAGGGVRGFVAQTFDEWSAALLCLLDSESMRQSMGFAGRQLVDEELNSNVQGSRLAKLYQEVARNG